MGSCLSLFYNPSWLSLFYNPSSSSSPPPTPVTSSLSPQINYDVFLSFRGEDTRRNFTSHLHNALYEKGIKTFIDDSLNRGDEISPSLFEAIEQSKISVIIFSKDYASSRWCLQELVKILDCRNRETSKQTVIPVFYGITPSDVRNQTGSFAKAFAEHEKRFKKSLDQVHKWKVALKEAANISGWHSSTDKCEAKVIKDIVKDVLQKLDGSSPSDIDNLVGIQSKIKEIESLLCIGTNNVCSVGIWGIGGIGKTTLAEVVFNKISSQFKGCSYFARNVRERCEKSDGLHFLQRELLSALLGDECVNVGTPATGHTFIKSRLGCKKLLITLDDVSDFTQIENLIGGFDCLGPQSRIIITSRDKQVLENCGVDQIYEIQGLLHHEALELLCKYAFKGRHPTMKYMELSERVTKYAGGIPLALKVLGSYLFRKEIKVWKSAIEKWEKKPHMNIYDVLRISYDGLDPEVQKIFLDIACFFKWDNIEYVTSALKACGFHTYDGIDDLIKKSLIVISFDNRITMHNLVEAMGKEIVKQECDEDPGRRSRLWHHDDIYHVFTENTVTEKIEGIALDMSKLREHILLNPCDFLKMRRLRLLKFHDSSSSEIMNEVHVSQDLEYNLTALRHLSWHGCSIKSPLSSLRLKNLVTLDMRWSKLEQLWNDVLELQSSMMDLKNVRFLLLRQVGIVYEKLPDYLVNDEELPDGMKLCGVSMSLSKCETVKCLPKEQLGGTHANNQTAGKVLSSLPIQDIMKADFEDTVNDTLYNLQKIKQMTFVQLNYPGCEVPKWFKFRSEGNSIIVKQSSHWFNHNYIGFVGCFVVVPYQDREKHCGIEWTWKIKSKDGFIGSTDSYCHAFSVKSSHVFLESVIFPFGSKLLHNEFECFPEFISEHSSRHFKIDKCGVHLMFSQYVDEVGGSSRVVKDENIFTFLKGC